MALTWTYESTSYGPSGDRVQYQHKIEIIDREGGLSGTFCGRNAVLSMNNPSRDVLGPLIASTSLTFEMKIEEDVHEQFIFSLTEFNERRFIVRYSRNGVLAFVGMIFLDEVTVQFTNKVLRDGALKPNGFFNVSAVDGITTLKDVDFVQSDGLPFLDRGSLGETLALCFESLPTIGFGQIAALVSNWEPDVGGTDLFTGTEVPRKVFLEEGRQGGYNFFSKYKVLEEICKALDLRLTYVSNIYVFEQLNTRSGQANTTLYSLPDFGAAGSYQGEYPLETIDCNYKWRISPDIRTFLPPYNSVKIEYKFDFLQNYASQIEWVSPAAGSVVCYSDLGKVPVPDADTYRARWAGTIQMVSEETTSPREGVYSILYRFQIKIGNQYFVRPIQGTAYYNNTVYEAAEWTTTPGYFEYVDPNPIILPGDFLIPKYVPFYITTLYIPDSVDDEELSLCFGFEVFDENNNSITPLGVGGFAVEAIISDGDLIIVEGDDTIVEKTQIDKIIFNGTVGTNTRGHIRDILFSTGPTKSSKGALSDDSVPPVFQEEWTGDQGTYTHYELLARTLMARAMNTQEFMEGRIKGPFQLGFTTSIGYDGAEWIPLRINYLTDQGQYEGEWWKLNLGDASGLTDKEEEIQLINRLPTGFGTATGPNNQPSVYSFIGENTCIDVDANNMNIPDLTGWDEDRIFARIEVYKQGVGLLYYKFEGTRVDEWWWDNDNRQICLGEQTRSQDKLVIRVWF